MPRADASRRRCAIYTRKSSEEGLEQEFNSLAAQREACEAYIRSQQHEGWLLARTRYDDGGFSGGNLEPFLGGFAGVDRATFAAGVIPRHLRLSTASPVGYAGCEEWPVADRLGFKPKKSGPDHAVPVIFL